MLSAIKDIGYLVSKKAWSSERPIEGKVLSVIIDAVNSSFSGIDIEDFDTKKIDLYLFSSGSSKGNVPSPFAPITEPEKTYKKIEKWMKDCEKITGIENDTREFLSRINKVLAENKDLIMNLLKYKIEGLPKKKGEGRYFTLGFEGNKRYLGEYEIFKRGVEDFAAAKLKKSAGKNQVCSVCGLVREEVSGKVDVFKFYTIDKPGFISGGFKEISAWKNFPVCVECKALLESGKKYIDVKLNFKFYGLNYYLTPRLLVGGEDILEDILNILSDTTKAIDLKERTKKRITNDENEILEFLSGIKDVLTLNFLFLRKEQSAERILLLIEDVFPSRIRRIFKAKDCVDAIFEDEFNFGKIRNFYSKSDEGKRESDLNKYFLEIVDSIFKERKLDFAFLLKFFMAVIRREFINEGYFGFRIKDALMNIMFFENLGLITFEEASMVESMFNGIFTQYGKSFGNPAKRGVFLLGALTQLLLNKQWNERNARPFMKKLKGLKMDEKDIRALLPEIQNKLEEYDSFDKGKRLIASEASKYLLEAGEGWKMPVDEINFYFSCGMNLVENVANIVYPKENIG
ncbi:MAG: TIGR02556 family CRISPR-associated protein [wastewater metagenome]|nr:TIGR02556 family CRISPR-associated protein [Candidatus Loosdrechtia aerotolerans]